jgi:transcriptional/translational regulatory protein YebC/TACO1
MLDPAREDICCEGYGPGGIAVIATCGGSEHPPPADEIRRAFRECGGYRGAVGSVAYLFRRVGVLRFAADAALRDRAWAAGAEEVLLVQPGTLDLCTDPDERQFVEQSLRRRGHSCLARGSGWRAMHTMQPSAVERKRLDELMKRLAGIEGVEHVYSNAQTTDELLAPV